MNETQLSERKFYVLLLSWGLLLVLFLWSLTPVLQPLVLFLALVYLLSPFYGTSVYGRVVTVLSLLTGLWLIWSVGYILTPFVLAIVLAYVLNPLVRRAQRKGLERTAATVLVLGLVLAILALTIIVLGPVLWEQVSNFLSRFPVFLQRALTWLQATLERVSHARLPGMDRVEVGELLAIDADRIDEFVTSRGEEIRGFLLSGVIGVGKGLGLALTLISYLVITPLLTFFLLRDFDKVVERSGALVPPTRRARTFAFVREFDVLLGKYLRSQLLVSLLVGLIIGGGFAIAGFPYAVLLGVVAGVFNVIPYLGLVLSLVPALLIALVSGNVGTDLLKIAAVFGVEQVLENYFSPRIVGESVGLHPFWVMLAIVLFAFFFGFIGLLIAVPAAVAIKLLLGNLLESYRASSYFREAEPGIEAGGTVLPAGAKGTA
ncbi:MAG: AI-2E family transporter [Gemmatimonadota bacterium]